MPDGGRIVIETRNVESRIGEGTTFSIYLPRLLPSVSHGKAQSQANPAGGVPLILLVDDEPMVRDVAARGLRAGGYRVLEAGMGAEALELQAEMGDEIALLISEVVMPGMSGVELAARMRAVRPELRVLYLSGYTADLLPQQGTLETGDPLLAKPFTTADLLRQVREQLPVEPTT